MNRNVSAVLIFIAGGLTGSVAGYYFAKKRLAEFYAQAADEEIQSVKKHYKLLRKEGLDGPEDLTKAEKGEETHLRMIIEESSYDFTSSVEEDTEPIQVTTDEEDNEEETRSIFDSKIVIDENGDPVEKDAFFEDRNEDEPFVISLDEFMHEEDDYDKVTLSYFVEDDTLCDDRDQIVPDVEGTVGIDNLMRFGDHSNDEATVYVRNHRLKTDFEVTREEGEYSVRVLGLQSEMIPRPKKFRMRDDE